MVESREGFLEEVALDLVLKDVERLIIQMHNGHTIHKNRTLTHNLPRKPTPYLQ